MVRTSGFSGSDGDSDGIPRLRLAIAAGTRSRPGWPARAGPDSATGRVERAGQAAQDLAALGCDQHVVLDPDSAPTRDVDPRLDGHDHARPQFDRAVTPEDRGLVDVPAQAVAEPVGEESAEAGLVDQRTRLGVDIPGH